MPSFNFFDKESIELYLFELAKELKKEYKRLDQPIEIVIVGGASILLNYSFRLSSSDIDCVEYPSNMIKRAANEVADKYSLPNGWINDDFKMTNSFAIELYRYSKYRKTYLHILEVRTISREYLLAMKLMSFREYKQDRSDIVNILIEEENRGTPISLEDIQRAVVELYGDFNKLEQEAKDFIVALENSPNKKNILDMVQSFEEVNRTEIINKNKK